MGPTIFSPDGSRIAYTVNVRDTWTVPLLPGRVLDVGMGQGRNQWDLIIGIPAPADWSVVRLSRCGGSTPWYGIPRLHNVCREVRHESARLGFPGSRHR